MLLLSFRTLICHFEHSSVISNEVRNLCATSSRKKISPFASLRRNDSTQFFAPSK